mgnify:FL=1|jgi:thiamine-phosphate pyrophosphorylase
MLPPVMRGLYAIIDTDGSGRRGIEVVDFARAVIRARPALVQLRAKHLRARDTLELLRSLRVVCSEVGVPLFANDRPDLALLAGCDGVHVGQSDLEVADLRSAFPSLKVGVSSHNLEEVEAALASRPDYVAFGPVFATGSKQDPDPVVGLEALAWVAARVHGAGLPLVAIGGIDLERAALVANHAELGAVIGALLPNAGESLGDVTDRVRALHSRLGGTT